MKLAFTKFDHEYLNKEGSLSAIGNGYFGLRGTHEEDYRSQKRGFFMRGFFDTAVGDHSAEIVNLPDVLNLELRIDGEVFGLEGGRIKNYERYLDFETGELVRSVHWQTKKGKWLKIINKRVAGQKNKHQLGIQLLVEPLDKECLIEVTTGIDGQISNGGSQHLVEQNLRAFAGQVLAAQYETISSQMTLGMTMAFNKEAQIAAKNRKISGKIKETCPKNTTFTFEKIISLYSSLETEEPFEEAKRAAETGITYQEIFQQSVEYWQQFWQKKRVVVKSTNEFDQLALDFSCYHLQIMAPEDPRFSIGAKGLTGEGYKGHVFWDTEIFILPFFLHTQPKIAADLLQYRFLNLSKAQEKAEQNNYEGALFPWESALTGEEETPPYAAINIQTGERQQVSSALAEHHIVADIAYAVVDYYQATKDEAFMEKYGKKLLQQTALFWLSRVNEVAGQLEICDVIGPDEYTEHINNNAYTNYMAAFNVKMAVEFTVGDEPFLERCHYFLHHLYYPKENSQQLIPQDDTFLQKPIIDLQKYRKKAGSQLILSDYTRQEVIEMQILKQADLVMLFYLQPQLFSREVIKKNLYYYEEKTIHDSSLSKAIHAIVASEINEEEWAYQMFQEACLIDLSDAPHSSDEGVHAASLGAIWLAAIFGFAGLTKSEVLEIAPKLPQAWEQLDFSFNWQNEELRFEIRHDGLQITKESKTPIELIVDGEKKVLRQSLICTRRTS